MLYAAGSAWKTEAEGVAEIEALMVAWGVPSGDIGTYSKAIYDGIKNFIANTQFSLSAEMYLGKDKY